MLIEKINCPYGCINSVMTETTRKVLTGNSNLLLDSSKSQGTLAEIIKVYSCTCCGRSFESKQPTDGKMVM